KTSGNFGRGFQCPERGGLSVVESQSGCFPVWSEPCARLQPGFDSFPASVLCRCRLRGHESTRGIAGKFFVDCRAEWRVVARFRCARREVAEIEGGWPSARSVDDFVGIRIVF